jgi:hypothetical protein
LSLHSLMVFYPSTNFHKNQRINILGPFHHCAPLFWALSSQDFATALKPNCCKSMNVWSLVKKFTATRISIVLCKGLKMDNVMCKQFYFVHLGHIMPCHVLGLGWSIFCHCSQVKLMQKWDCLKPCKVIHSCQSVHCPLRKS